jgi:signal transduction histidine kinase
MFTTCTHQNNIRNKLNLNSINIKKPIKHTMATPLQTDDDFEMNRDFLLSVLNSVTSNIAVINNDGIIIAVNKPWQIFANENDHCASDIGTNYLSICKAGFSCDGADQAYEGISNVLAGHQSHFILEYPCHSQHQQRWFEMNVTSINMGAQSGAVITHNNITKRHLMQAELKNQADSREAESQKLAHALEKLRQLAANLEFGLVDERKRIAYELHDELGQLLAALRLDIGMLKMECGTQHSELVPRANQMQLILDRALSSMYGIVTNLRPTILDLGLIAALEWLRDDFSRTFNIRCHFDCIGNEREISDAQLTLIFRFAQELLTNAARHANASFVSIRLQFENSTLQLSVQDDGIGFDPDHAQYKSHCFGLFGIQERVLALGGIVLIDTAHDMGSCVTLQIPLSR